MTPLILACDHAGFQMKTALIDFFKNRFDIIDCGTNSSDSVDYPFYAKKGIEALKEHPHGFGIFICGTGIGMSIAANRFSSIRAALCRTPDDAIMARQHNNANVLCLGGRITPLETAKIISDTFLKTPFSNEERHLKRIQQLTEY